MRSALRNRDMLIKKLICQGGKNKQESLAEFRRVSHMVIKVNHLVFIDLAGIEGLSHTDPEIVQHLTKDFSAMAN
jgi:hypothetical protein